MPLSMATAAAGTVAGPSPEFLRALAGPFAPSALSSSSSSIPPGFGPGLGNGLGFGLSRAFSDTSGLGVGLTAAPGAGALPAHARAQPAHPHAYVTFGAGMRQRDIDAFAAAHALPGAGVAEGEGASSTGTSAGGGSDAAGGPTTGGGTGEAAAAGTVPYHVPMSAHPVGSAIMGLAGFGFISRLYGLSVDNVVEVEMVLADGRVVIVNKDADPGASRFFYLLFLRPSKRSKFRY